MELCTTAFQLFEYFIKKPALIYFSRAHLQTSVCLCFDEINYFNFRFTAIKKAFIIHWPK